MVERKEGYKDTEIGVIPVEWDVVKVGDFCDILDNKRVPLSSEQRATIKGNVPYYGANGVVDYINDFLFDEELVLLAEDGGNFSEYETRPIAYMIYGKSWVNNHTHILRVKNGQNHFLFYNLVHKNIMAFINGGTRAKLNRGELVKIPIPLPPLKEQEKIADILSTADEKIDAIASQIQKAQTVKKGLLQKLLSVGIGHSEFKDSELGKIPKSWEVVKLEDVSKIVDSLHITPSFVKNGISMVRVSDIKSGALNLDDTLKVTKDTFMTFTKNYTPKKDDIVLSRVGSYGVSSYVMTNEAFCMGQNTVVINPIVNNKYVYYYLNSIKIFKQIEIASYGSGYKSLSLKNIRELKVALPPLKEQKQIAEILSTADAKIEVLMSKKEMYETLKKGLLQKLLSGEVRVYYE